MPVFTRLETARLRLRHFAASDLAGFVAYRNDPDVARYQSWEGISEPEARAFIAEQQVVQPGVPGQWFQIAVELKDTGALVGDCALKIEELDAHQAEIGYTLSRGYQGRGLATEAVARVLEYAFMTLGLYRVFAITDCENEASVAVLERLGFRRESDVRQNVWFKGRWADEYRSTMRHEEWRSMQSTNGPR
jgi:RimJ/RimL family protein N-acetyltransferase